MAREPEELPISIDIETPAPAPLTQEAGATPPNFNSEVYRNFLNQIQGINYGLNAPTHQEYQNLAGLANVYDEGRRFHIDPIRQTVSVRGQQAGQGERLTPEYIDELSDWEYVRAGLPLPRPDTDDAAHYAAPRRGGIVVGHRFERGPDEQGGSGPALHGESYRAAPAGVERGRVETVPPRGQKEIPVRGTDNTQSVINLISSIPNCDISTAALFLADGRAVRVTPQEVREISLVKFVDSIVDQARRTDRIADRIINLNLGPTMKIDLVPHGLSTLHTLHPPTQRTLVYEGSLAEIPRFGVKEPWSKLAQTFFAREPERITQSGTSWFRYHFKVNLPATIWVLKMRWPQGDTPLYELPGTQVYAVGKKFLRHLNIGNVNLGTGRICWGSANERIQPANPEAVQEIFYNSLFNSDLTNGEYFSFAEGGVRLNRWVSAQKKKPDAIPARFVVGSFFKTLGSPANYFNNVRR